MYQYLISSLVENKTTKNSSEREKKSHKSLELWSQIIAVARKTCVFFG